MMSVMARVIETTTGVALLVELSMTMAISAMMKRALLVMRDMTAKTIVIMVMVFLWS